MEKRPYLILSVDDSLIFQSIIKKTLVEAGHNVIVANSGKEALALLEAETPDLILLDVVMPGMSGYETAREIKSMPKKADIPIMFLTTESNPKEELEGLSIGAYDYLFKPFMPEILLRRIENVMDHMELKNEFKKQLDIKTEQLNQVIWQSLTNISTLVDSKSRFTVHHSENVAKISAVIARELEWDDDEIAELSHTALLHDIGRLSVPDDILVKPAALTDDEYNTVKQHTVVGIELLNDLGSFPQIRESVRWHHERYDGNGYPDRLKGNKIPIKSRIIAVADAYEAMSSDRPYRKALTSVEIVNELLMGKGAQFDPRLADIMIKLISDDFSVSRLPSVAPYGNNTASDSIKLLQKLNGALLPNTLSDD